MALTDDDKQWFKAELKGFEALVERVEALVQRVEARVEGVEARVERVEAQIEHLEAKIERVETALLTEFHKWASPIEMRVRTHAAAFRAIDAELGAVCGPGYQTGAEVIYRQ